MVGQHRHQRADATLVVVADNSVRDMISQDTIAQELVALGAVTPGAAALDAVLRGTAAPDTVAPDPGATDPLGTPAPRAPRSSCPGPAHAPPRRSGAPLPALGGEFLSAALDLLRRDEPLSRAEIGDHADVVAEVADALAAVADRLVRDLDALGADAAGDCGHDLAGARDALQEGSSDSRRGAAMLWARHIAELRAGVEQARAEPARPAHGRRAVDRPARRVTGTSTD